MAIPDWNMKRELARIAFGFPRVNDVVHEYFDVIGPPELDDADPRGKLLDLWGRWGKIRTVPSRRYASFFEWISKKLQVQETIFGQSIIRDGIADFFDRLGGAARTLQFEALNRKDILDDEYRTFLASRAPAVPPAAPLRPPAVNTIEGRNQQPPQARAAYAVGFPLWHLYNDKLRTIMQGFDAKHIDQSFYYQTPESTSLWFAITNSPEYSLFDSCSVGLSRLVTSTEWAAFVGSPEFHGVVMLGGGGAPIKDLVILRSMLRHDRFRGVGEVVRHALIDTSSFMLETSRRDLEEKLKPPLVQDREKIEIECIKCDIMNLETVRSFLPRPTGKKVAWFLTGGTIGNLNEAKFFESVANVAEPGDWLVVAAGCFDQTPNREALKALENEYMQTELRDFIRSPLRALWTELKLPGTAEDAVDRIHIKAIHGQESLSSVLDATTVTGKVTLPDHGEILLFKSSRYREESLIRLANDKQWHHVTTFLGLDKNFKHIVLKFRM